MLVVLGGCGTGSEAASQRSVAVEASSTGTPSPSVPVPEARVGEPAASTRVRFVPTAVVLPGGARTAVEPASTVRGELAVPENVRHVGWWDGSAAAGDPFGTTVIAGHVDSATDGLGFFARLLEVEPGEVVIVRDADHRQRYRIISVRTVAKQALVTSSAAFDQTGEHRLTLITCTGAYRADRGGYESNLVVTAVPLGPAR